jgi:acetylornithine deacetylase/succinyl-diaminopimelate desuccinylase-like protein
MDFIRSFVEQEDPGALVVRSGLQGFSDSHWWRQAFPGCVVYGFMPARAFDVFDATPLVHGVDERVPVADLGLGARFFAKLITEMLDV